MTEVFDGDRGKADQYDDRGQHVNLVAHPFVTLAEREPEERHPTAPKHAAGDVERDECGRAHSGHAGHDRSKSAHKWYKPGEYNGFRPIAFEELVRLGDVFWVENTRFGFVEQFWADSPPEEVADLVPEHRRHDYAENDQHDVGVDYVGSHQQASSEEQGIAGEEEPEEQPRFGEHDKEQSDRAVVVDQLARVEPEGEEAHEAERLVLPKPKAEDAASGSRRPFRSRANPLDHVFGEAQFAVLMLVQQTGHAFRRAGTARPFRIDTVHTIGSTGTLKAGA